jgi:hypothetical protein
MFDEIRSYLAECIFNYTCQTPLELNDTVFLMNFIKNNCQMLTCPSVPNKSYIETPYLYLIMAVLYCFDTGFLESRSNGKIFKW